MQVTIREVTRENAHDIARIERECFSAPWSEEAVTSELEKKNTHIVAAFDGKVLCGYAGMYFVCDEGYIFNIAVSENKRRCGIGAVLVRELIAFSKEQHLSFLSLEVRKSNSAAVKLYDKLGFVSVGERKNFYTKPVEDAMIMTYYV